MEKDKTVEISEAARILEKKRILYDIEEAFQLQVEDYNVEIKKFLKKEENIKLNDLVVQKKLIKTSKQLIENKIKKKRAERRLKDEGVITQSIQNKIEKVIEEIKILEEHRKIFEESNSKLKKYEEFLENIVKDSQKQYSDVEDFLKRFEILQKNNQILKLMQEEKEKENEIINQKIIKEEKNQLNEIMILNNEIASLQYKLEKMEQANLNDFSAIGN